MIANQRFVFLIPWSIPGKSIILIIKTNQLIDNLIESYHIAGKPQRRLVVRGPELGVVEHAHVIGRCRRHVGLEEALALRALVRARVGITGAARRPLVGRHARLCMA